MERSDALPTKLNKNEKELLKALAKERGESVEVDSNLWDEIKHSFS
jgi:uncharacterized membrane protein